MDALTERLSRCSSRRKNSARLLNECELNELPRHQHPTVASRGRSASRTRSTSRHRSTSGEDSARQKNTRQEDLANSDAYLANYLKLPRTSPMGESRKKTVKKIVTDSEEDFMRKFATKETTRSLKQHEMEHAGVKSLNDPTIDSSSLYGFVEPSIRYQPNQSGTRYFAEPEMDLPTNYLKKPTISFANDHEFDLATNIPTTISAKPASPIFSPDTTVVLENATKVLNEAERQMSDLNLTTGLNSPTRTEDKEKPAVPKMDDQLLHIQELVISKLHGLKEDSSSSSSSPRNPVNRPIPTPKSRNLDDPIAKVSRLDDSKYQQQHSTRFSSYDYSPTKIPAKPDNTRFKVVTSGESNKISSNLKIKNELSFEITPELKMQTLANVHISPDNSFVQSKSSNVGIFEFQYGSSKESGEKVIVEKRDTQQRTTQAREQKMSIGRCRSLGSLDKSDNAESREASDNVTGLALDANFEVEETSEARNAPTVQEKRTVIGAATAAAVSIESSGEKDCPGYSNNKCEIPVNSVKTFFTALKRCMNKNGHQNSRKKTKKGITKKKISMLPMENDAGNSRNPRGSFYRNAKFHFNAEQEDLQSDSSSICKNSCSLANDAEEALNSGVNRRRRRDEGTDHADEESSNKNLGLDGAGNRISEDDDEAAAAAAAAAAADLEEEGREGTDGEGAAATFKSTPLTTVPLIKKHHLFHQLSSDPAKRFVPQDEPLTRESLACRELNDEEIDIVDGAVDHFIKKMLLESASEEIRGMNEQLLENRSVTSIDESQSSASSSLESNENETRRTPDSRYPAADAIASIGEHRSHRFESRERLRKVEAEFEEMLKKHSSLSKPSSKANRHPPVDALDGGMSLRAPKVSDLDEIIRAFDQIISRVRRDTDEITRSLSQYEFSELFNDNAAEIFTMCASAPRKDRGDEAEGANRGEAGSNGREGPMKDAPFLGRKGPRSESLDKPIEANPSNRAASDSAHKFSKKINETAVRLNSNVKTGCFELEIPSEGTGYKFRGDCNVADSRAAEKRDRIGTEACESNKEANSELSTEEISVFRKLMQALKHANLEDRASDEGSGLVLNAEQNKLLQDPLKVALVPPVIHRTFLGPEELRVMHVEGAMSDARDKAANASNRQESLTMMEESNDSETITDVDDDNNLHKAVANEHVEIVQERSDKADNIALDKSRIMVNESNEPNIVQQEDFRGMKSQRGTSVALSEGKNGDEAKPTEKPLEAVADGIIAAVQLPDESEGAVEEAKSARGSDGGDVGRRAKPLQDAPRREESAVAKYRDRREENLSKSSSTDAAAALINGKLQHSEEDRGPMGIFQCGPNKDRLTIERYDQRAFEEQILFNSIAPALQRCMDIMASGSLLVNRDANCEKTVLIEDFRSELSVINEEVSSEYSHGEQSQTKIRQSEKKEIDEVCEEAADVAKNVQAMSSARSSASGNSARDNVSTITQDAERSATDKSDPPVTLSLAQLNESDNSLQDCASLPMSEATSWKSDKCNNGPDTINRVQLRKQMIGYLEKCKLNDASPPAKLLNVNNYGNNVASVNDVENFSRTSEKSSTCSNYGRSNLVIGQETRHHESDSELDAASAALSQGEIFHINRSSSLSLGEIDIDSNLESQEPFHVFLHKLTDTLAHAENGDSNASCIIARVQDYISTNPELIVIDPLKNVRKLCNRYKSYDTIREGVKLNDVFMPNFVELRSTDVDENVSLLKKNRISFPFLCKPLIAHGSSDAHKMMIIFSEKGVKNCQTPCVAQDFINHNAILYKLS
ncbi:uncharacterized protein [Prorops nasuta]|uniref:uncharacterized protein isoform X2 n=1 Tax=Prorops nasuta TaxID=863751 RepID=UPI0034CE65B3